MKERIRRLWWDLQFGAYVLVVVLAIAAFLFACWAAPVVIQTWLVKWAWGSL